MKRTKTNYRRCTRDISPCSMLSRRNVTVSPLFFFLFFSFLFSFPLLTRRWSTFAWEKAKCHALIEDRKSSFDILPLEIFTIHGLLWLVVKFLSRNASENDIFEFKNFFKIKISFRFKKFSDGLIFFLSLSSI